MRQRSPSSSVADEGTTCAPSVRGELVEEPLEVVSADGGVDSDRRRRAHRRRVVGQREAGRQLARHTGGDDGRRRHQRLELLGCEPDEERVAGDHGRARTATLEQHRTLAERDARPGLGSEHRSPVHVSEEADAPGDDAVQAIGRVPLAEQPYPGRHLQPLDGLGQRGEGLAAEPGEGNQRLQSDDRVGRGSKRRQLDGSRRRDLIDVDGTTVDVAQSGRWASAAAERRRRAREVRRAACLRDEPDVSSRAGGRAPLLSRSGGWGWCT